MERVEGEPLRKGTEKFGCFKTFLSLHSTPPPFLFSPFAAEFKDHFFPPDIRGSNLL